MSVNDAATKNPASDIHSQAEGLMPQSRGWLQNHPKARPSERKRQWQPPKRKGMVYYILAEE